MSLAGSLVSSLLVVHHEADYPCRDDTDDAGLPFAVDDVDPNS